MDQWQPIWHCHQWTNGICHFLLISRGSSRVPVARQRLKDMGRGKSTDSCGTHCSRVISINWTRKWRWMEEDFHFQLAFDFEGFQPLIFRGVAVSRKGLGRAVFRNYTKITSQRFRTAKKTQHLIFLDSWLYIWGWQKNHADFLPVLWKLLQSWKNAFENDDVTFPASWILIQPMVRRDSTKFCRYGCFRKFWYPQIIHFNRVFHYKPIHFGGPPVFLETSISPKNRWIVIFGSQLISEVVLWLGN